MLAQDIGSEAASTGMQAATSSAVTSGPVVEMAKVQDEIVQFANVAPPLTV